jgi:hypothetical protein
MDNEQKECPGPGFCWDRGCPAHYAEPVATEKDVERAEQKNALLQEALSEAREGLLTIKMDAANGWPLREIEDPADTVLARIDALHPEGGST